MIRNLIFSKDLAIKNGSRIKIKALKAEGRDYKIDDGLKLAFGPRSWLYGLI